MKKYITFILLWMLGCAESFGQLTVEQAWEMARRNYPQVRQYDLIGRSEQYSLQNASKGYLPQLGLSGKATYQSDVTTIPISLEGITVPTLSKDQYQVVGELSQIIWDGGAIRAGKDNIRAQADAERAQYEVDMYALRGRIDDLFFGILLLDEQLRLNEVYLYDLQTNLSRVESYAANGLANEADLDAVRVEQLTALQSRTELESMRRAYLTMLSAFTGRKLDSAVELVKPDYAIYTREAVERMEADNRRPELNLFEAYERQWEAQREGIAAAGRPRFDAFVQGGYGKPGLNMFKDKFSFYGIGGLRLSWNFASLYTRRDDLRKIDVEIQQVEVQRETFLFNSSLQSAQLDAEYEKYRSVMAADDRIIEMRSNIVRASEAKLENGILSATDLVRELNARQTAQVNKAVHEIELLRTIYEWKNLTNN